jgi:N-acetylmuramoyl-L-alanine amidase
MEKMRRIKEIIVHCSATEENRNYTVEDINGWHKARGFRCIGYHYVIYRDGSVHTGRSEAEVGAHCRGHNRESIGVCYIGGLSAKTKQPKDTRTAEQREALRALVKELQRKYPGAEVHGHREYANKACPCFDVATEL